MTTIAIKTGSQTGAELLVKCLERQGVEYVFGIPGAKILTQNYDNTRPIRKPS